MAKNQYKIRTITCKGCGKSVTKRMPKTRVYCSQKCHRTSPRPKQRKGKYIDCKQCGKKVYKSKVFLESGCNLFCSSKCSNEHQKCEKIKYICKICDQAFYVYPSTVKIRTYKIKYCSMSCRNKDDEYLKRAALAGNMVQQKSKGPNRIEKIGYSILDDIGVKYYKQHPMFNKFIVDAFLPEHNIVIQWDGDYWHGHPSKIKNGKPDSRQKQRMLLDKSQDAYMKKCGITVLRFWEHQILNNKEIILEDIKKSI